MQYILNEDEYKQLVAAANKKPLVRLSTEGLQTLCTKICNEMPVVWEGWLKERPPSPWGCKLTNENEWYCDNCPVQTICPTGKSWSK